MLHKSRTIGKNNEGHTIFLQGDTYIMKPVRSENKIAYIVLAFVLTALTVVVIATAVASRRAGKKYDETSGSDTAATTTAPETTNKQQDTEDAVITNNDEETSDIADNNDTEDKEEEVNAEPQLPNFQVPVIGVISKEHSVSALVFSVTMNDYRTHNGVDIATTDGADVHAVADGVVEELWQDPLMGYCISISHEGDALSIYKNLRPESISGLSAGDKVVAGQVIGSVGDSALIEIAEEPHLHFELKIGGVSVDPCDYIDFPAAEDTPEG